MTDLSHRPLGFVLAAIAATMLAGCGGEPARKILGFDQSTPDEFAVAPRAPLAMPPTDELPPPQLGARRPQEPLPADQARLILFGEPAAVAVAPSAAEQALLAEAGASPSPDIRTTVELETRDIVASNSTVLFFWQRPRISGDVIDARAEAERLNQAAAAGQPATSGETPVIRPKPPAPLEGVLDALFD